MTGISIISHLSDIMDLSLYHAILTFNYPENKGFWKHCRKRRKCWKPAFSPFPTMFSTLSKTKIIMSSNSILLSANAFNLDQSKNLMFGKELNIDEALQYLSQPVHRIYRIILTVQLPLPVVEYHPKTPSHCNGSLHKDNKQKANLDT